MRTKRLLALASFTLASLFASMALADDAPHGPSAPDNQFPSHHFQLAAHQPKGVQLAVHYGLAQPIFYGGFNAAFDFRYKRFIATYSHGQGLDITSTINAAEKAAGMKLREPWTTGGGVGVLLIDELYLMADVKVHRFEAEAFNQHASYSTMTVGAEVGWRFFVWKGFNLGVVGRYWPNVWSTAQDGVAFKAADGQTLVHQPAHQGASGVFANLLVGWAFNL
jgi:hypothetical protein